MKLIPIQDKPVNISRKFTPRERLWLVVFAVIWFAIVAFLTRFFIDDYSDVPDGGDLIIFVLAPRVAA